MSGDAEHGLRVELATALRERDGARHGLDEWCKAAMQERHRAEAAESERDALRAALEKYRHCRHACVECFCVKEARAALASGGDRP